MQNMIQLQDDLKNFSEQQLVREMQMPSGQVPQFLILTELGRRKRMRDDFSRQQAAGAPTVAEETVAAAGMPVGASTDMAKAMAPKTSMAENTGIGAMMPKQPTRMADGGDVEPRNRFEMLMAYLRSLREKEEEPKPTSTGPSIAEMINFGGDYEPVKKAEGGVVKANEAGFIQALMDKRGLVGDTRLGDKFPFNTLGYTSGEKFSDNPDAFKPAPPFPANDRNPRKRGEWMEQYGETHNLDGSPKFTDPNTAVTDVGISSLSADTDDYMPPSIAMQTQSKLSEAASPDRYVPRMGDPNPLGRALMDEYRANMAEASVTATDTPSNPLQQVSEGLDDSTIPASGSELVDTSIEDKTLTTPSIRGNDGSSEQLELGIDPTQSRLIAEPVYNAFENAKNIPLDPSYGAPTLETDAPAGPISIPIDNKGGIYSFDEKGNVVGGDQSYAARFGFTPSIDEPVGATQEAIDSAEEAAELREEQGITDASNSVGALLAAGDEAAAQKIIEDARKAAKKDEETPDPDLPGGGGDTPKPDPDLPGGGGVKSALSGELGGMQGELAEYLKDMEKSRDQDKWLALANMGLALMASKQPTLGGAIGEAGMKGMKDLQAGKKAYSKDKLAIMALQQRIDAAKLAAQTSLDVANIRAAAAGKGSASSANTTNRVMLKELLGEVNKELELLTPLSGGAVPAENLDRYNELVTQRTAIIREMEKLTTLPILGDTDSTELAGVFDVPTPTNQ